MGFFKNLLGGGSQSTSQTTSVEPWREQVPYLQDVFRQAQGLYQGQGPQYFQGQTVAQPTALQEQGRGLMSGYAANGMQNLAQQAQQANQFSLYDILFPQSNPALAAYQQSATLPLYQGLTEETLPAIRAGAVGAGQYGGSRQGIAEGLAAGRTAQAAGNVQANIANQGYLQGLEAQGRAMALAPQMAQFGLMPGQTMEAIGAAQQQQNQANINADMARWNWEQNLPYQRLREFYGLVSGPFGSTSTTTGSTSGGGGLPGMIAGGAMGAGLGSMLGNPAGIGTTFSGINGAGTLSGAAAGVSNPYMLPLAVLGSLFGGR